MKSHYIIVAIGMNKLNKSKPKSQPSLEDLRKKIDHIDEAILKQINQRALYAIEIGKIKEKKTDFTYKPEREKAIVERLEKFLQSEIKNPRLPKESIKFVFSEIISVCRSLEKPPVIGYLGPEGSFTHVASIKQFGSSATLQPLKNFELIFKEIEKNNIDYGVIPIENSIEGMVNHSIDLFQNSRVMICAELFMNIHLNLFSHEKSLDKIKKVYSHPQPFAQSKNWLHKHLPNAELISTSSTSDAANFINDKKNKSATACIASKHIGALFPKLNNLAVKIEDKPNNTTRFAVITQQTLTSKKVNPNNITSLIIMIKDKAGALYEILALMAKAEINLTNLVSRPSRKKAFDYLFYIDFIGHPEEKRIQKVLIQMKKHVVSCEIIGNYPRGITYQ